MKGLMVILVLVMSFYGCAGGTRSFGDGSGQVVCSDVQDQITATDFCKAIDLIEKNKSDCPNLNSDLSGKVAKAVNDSGILGAQLTMLRAAPTFGIEDLIVSSAYSAPPLLLPPLPGSGCYSTIGATWLACNFSCAYIRTDF